MSSLQKFHRRTNGGAPATWPATAIGMGDSTHGYWVGDVASNKLIASPITTDVYATWGSYGINRGATSRTNGLGNTNTLYAFGSAAHPAAYYCKSLTTGGYNTWYLPAIDELKLVTNFLYIYENPYSTSYIKEAYTSKRYYWSSSENGNNQVATTDYGAELSVLKYEGASVGGRYISVRAVRRTYV